MFVENGICASFIIVQFIKIKSSWEKNLEPSSVSITDDKLSEATMELDGKEVNVEENTLKKGKNICWHEHCFLFKMSKYCNLTRIIIKSHWYMIVIIVNNNTVATLKQKPIPWIYCFSQMQTWILRRRHGATAVSTSVLWSLPRTFQETVKTTQS